MLNQQKLQEIAGKLKRMYPLRDGSVQVVYVSSGLRDAIIEVGRKKFAITEKENGIPIIAFGQALQKVEYDGRARWRGTTVNGEVLEADYRNSLAIKM